MKRMYRFPVIVMALLVFGGAARADDLEGRIEGIDAAARTLTVQGIIFQVTDRTEYDDLEGFGELSPGQRVEIDFEYRDGRHVAREIELEE